MKYESPIMEIMLIERRDVVTLSGESIGSGDNVEGGWNS